MIHWNRRTSHIYSEHSIIKELMDNNTIVGNFDTLLPSMDRSSKQKMKKETMALSDTVDQRDLKDIFTTFHSNTAEYIFFSSAHGIFSRIDHILGHKSGLNLYQKNGIIPCIFSDHSALKLELNDKRKLGRNTNTWVLKSIQIKNEQVKQEIKEFKKFMEAMK